MVVISCSCYSAATHCFLVLMTCDEVRIHMLLVISNDRSTKGCNGLMYCFIVISVI